MTDNVAITAGSGTTIATDDISGVHYQRVKVTWGADGTGNDASTSNPLPTQVNAALPAGTNEVGKVNWTHFSVAGATLTRPANTTAYAIGDSVSDNATAGSVTALTTNDLSDTNDIPVTVMEILLDSTDTGPGTAAIQIRLHLFNSNPTSSSGVVGGDNAAWSNKKAGWVGAFSGTMTAFSDGSKGVLVPDAGTARIALPVSGAKNMYYQLQTLGAFTPSANSTTFIPRFIGYQGR